MDDTVLEETENSVDSLQTDQVTQSHMPTEKQMKMGPQIIVNGNPERAATLQPELGEERARRKSAVDADLQLQGSILRNFTSKMGGT